MNIFDQVAVVRRKLGDARAVLSLLTRESREIALAAASGEEKASARQLELRAEIAAASAAVDELVGAIEIGEEQIARIAQEKIAERRVGDWKAALVLGHQFVADCAEVDRDIAKAVHSLNRAAEHVNECMRKIGPHLSLHIAEAITPFQAPSLIQLFAIEILARRTNVHLHLNGLPGVEKLEPLAHLAEHQRRVIEAHAPAAVTASAEESGA